MTRTLHYRLHQVYLVSLLSIAGLLPAIADNSTNIFRPSDGWQVDGQHGVIHVSGSLTENPCHLSMESSNQTVSLGNITRAELNNAGGSANPVPFQIELLDCLEVHSELQNTQTGTKVWSTTQPAVKVRFVAPSVPQYANVIRVNGAEGMGLRVTNVAGQILPIGKDSNPMLIASGQNQLTYYISAIKTSGSLIPGIFSALIFFEILYD